MHRPACNQRKILLLPIRALSDDTISRSWNNSKKESHKKPSSWGIPDDAVCAFHKISVLLRSFLQGMKDQSSVTTTTLDIYIGMYLGKYVKAV